MSGRTRSCFNIFRFSVLMIAILAPSQSAADWNIYVAPGMGISTAVVKTDGKVGPSDLISLGGSDSDSSPLLDLAVGLEVPLDELVPREWLLDVRLPDWPLRVELEAAGLREFELRTKIASNEFFTQMTATTFMVNFWLDIPMIAAYKPVQYTLGLGRQPGLRRWLKPASFYVGGGVGFGALEIDGTSNAVSGDDKPIDFAGNAGLGINYSLTESVALSLGYRFVYLGKQSVNLSGATPGPTDRIGFEPDVHELRVAVRIRVFEFLSPWR